MNLNDLEIELEELNHRLRIILLQNIREEDGYDEDFLFELNQITRRILGLRQLLQQHTEPLIAAHPNLYQLPVSRH